MGVYVRVCVWMCIIECVCAGMCVVWCGVIWCVCVGGRPWGG